jgi:hypothetical protein
MKLDKNYKVRVTPEQSREIHSLILLDGGEVSYGLKPQLQDEFLVIENEYGSVVIYYTDQDIFLSAEQQEIQADDLIALLTDLSKSAENTLENTELTPEFEAVEPVLADNSVNTQDNSADIKDTPKFKVGDKVYIPNIKNLCTIRNDGKVITSDGQYYCNLSDSHDLCFVLATPENYEMLCKLYPHIEFEAPPKELMGSDLVRDLIKKGWKDFACVCGNSGDDNVMITTIVTGTNNSGQFVDFKGRLFNNAIPMLGSYPLTQAVLDE